jgi:hypothetical protein
MKIPVTSPYPASDICDTFTVALTTDSNLFQSLTVTIPTSPANNHFNADNSFSGFSGDNSAASKTLVISST